MAVNEFFQTRKMHPGFNSTIVTLVLKCSNPCSIRDFRPISYCSVIYKCLTKIIANRLKKYMPQLVGNNQSAFIPGRSITDNILMAQELVRGYGRSSLSLRCAIKIDLQKAFDCLNWEFVLNVLIVLQFPSMFIDWISACITSPRFSILVNGGLVGYFKGQGGLDKGTPSLPIFLFWP